MGILTCNPFLKIDLNESFWLGLHLNDEMREGIDVYEMCTKIKLYKTEHFGMKEPDNEFEKESFFSKKRNII